MIPSRDEFVAFLTQDAASPLEARMLMRRFDVAPAERKDFMAFLQERVDAGDVVEIKGGQYAHPTRVGLLVGRLTVHPDGFGFVIPDDKDAEDLHVRGHDLSHAMHGDRVVARVEKRGRRPSGRIIRILTRAHTKLIGALRMRKRVALVVPLDLRLVDPVVVGRDDLLGATDGQIVEVEITQYPTADGPPEGRVTHVLGFPGEPDVEANAIALKHGVRVDFPEETEAEAARFPGGVRAADRKGREDLRKIPFVTIDGEKAKDFDDAVHVTPLADGYLLRVAIADVSHYVRVGTAVEAEARLRGTSTYFPDRVFPMLPEALSNNLCSLVPRQDRLAMVAEMEYTRGGRRRAQRFYPAVICSSHRLTYTEVARVLDDPDCDDAARLGETAGELLGMWELGRLIRSRRKERGSIDFDLPEAEIILDLRGKPEDIVKSERNHAHFLIEEFMIAANEAVAEHLEAMKLHAPFRIHLPPNPDTVEEFRRFVHNFGYTLAPGRRTVRPADFQALVTQSEGKPEARMLHQMMLRSMKKAVYAPENVGHFGLASEHYLHFTSPIRRYPDLIVHRILKETFKGRVSKDRREGLREELAAECPRLSDRERASESAEREAVAWKKCQFMADKVGTIHWGFVTGVASFGFFVELEQYFVDGLVHVSSLKDDFYHHSEELQALIGERTHRKFRIGDRVRVRLDRVDVARRQMDFTLDEGKKP